jgi:hypothetical protein
MFIVFLPNHRLWCPRIKPIAIRFVFGYSNIPEDGARMRVHGQSVQLRGVRQHLHASMHPTRVTTYPTDGGNRSIKLIFFRP